MMLRMLSLARTRTLVADIMKSIKTLKMRRRNLGCKVNVVYNTTYVVTCFFYMRCRKVLVCEVLHYLRLLDFNVWSFRLLYKKGIVFSTFSPKWQRRRLIPLWTNQRARYGVKDLETQPGLTHDHSILTPIRDAILHNECGSLWRLEYWNTTECDPNKPT